MSHGSRTATSTPQASLPISWNQMAAVMEVPHTPSPPLPGRHLLCRRRIAAKQPVASGRNQEDEAAAHALQRRQHKGLVPSGCVVRAASPLQQVAGDRHPHHARQRARRVADAPAGWLKGDRQGGRASAAAASACKSSGQAGRAQPGRAQQCFANHGAADSHTAYMTTPANLGATSMWLTLKPPREKPAQPSTSVVASMPQPTERAPAGAGRGAARAGGLG